LSGELRSRLLDLPNRGSFFVRTGGPAHGPAVVLLHGLGASAVLNWSAALPVLSGDFRVVAPDIRGHGDTRAFTRFTLEQAADDVVALADALAINSFVAVGYSMGGAIAQLVHRRHPHRLRGLVLCATSRSFCDTWRERLMFAALPSVRVASRAVSNDVARMTARRLTARVFNGECQAAITSDRTFDVGRVLEAAAALGDFDSRTWIGRVDVPSAILVHLRDQVVPPFRQLALAHAMAGATVHPFDADHFGVTGKPEVFVSILEAALRGVQRRACVPSAMAM
jgi:3-oxoadipate enol-lactonase